MAGGQDTQDHQDTQDVAGPQMGKRGARASGWQVTSAKRGPVARVWLGRCAGEWLASGWGEAP